MEKFQREVGSWMLACFGEVITADQLERADRFTEEALELAQTMPGFSADRAHALVDYVFQRPVGERRQEVGGVMVTLAALCNTVGLDVELEAAREVARIWTKVDVIRAKQAAKPTGSALPVAESEIQGGGWSWWAAEVDSPEDKPEIYGINEATREGVVAAARREFGSNAHIMIVEATTEGSFNARPFDEDGDCRHIHRILEVFADENGERWGEGDGPTSLPSDHLAKALNDAFEQFIRDNHGAVMEGAWSFTGTRNAEWLPPEAAD